LAILAYGQLPADDQLADGDLHRQFLAPREHGAFVGVELRQRRVVVSEP
jgi:hypothetical protein